MAKRRIPALYFSSILALAILSNRAGADDKSWALTLHAPIAGKYIWRGVSVVDGLVLQPSAAVGHAGFSASVWSNLELCHINDYGGRYGDGAYDFTEVDFTADYTFILNHVGLGAGLIHYQFPNTPFQSITEAYFILGFEALLTPTLTIFQDIDKVKGTYIHLALSHTISDLWEISDSAKLSLDIAGAIAFGTEKHNKAYYGVSDPSPADTNLSIGMPLAVSKGWTVTPTLHVSTFPADDIRQAVAKPDNLWVSVGVSYAF